jgi:aspartate aminotransferase
MSISQIAASISESATLKLNATAAALRAQGEPVIHLGGGEPQSKAPMDALLAASALLNTGEVRYTPASGLPELKEAIIGYTEKFYGRTVAPQNVMASGGAKQAIMVALHAVVDPHDEVIFPVPYWVSYPDMARLCGGVPVPVRAPDGSPRLQLADIEKHVTARTKVILLNSPNNPSGVMYSDEFIAGVIRLCERRGIYLIMDDIYQRLVFDGREPFSCYQYAQDTGEESRLIVVNGVSKQYAMTGFRIGWAVASQKLISVMGRIQGHQTSGPSALSQHAAIGALAGSQDSVEVLRTTLENNRNVLLDQLQGIPGIRVIKPDGTFYSFVDFRHYEPDSLKLAQYLLEEARVVTIPGVAFGLDGFLRVSFCGSVQDIITGVDRIKQALASYGGGKR